MARDTKKVAKDLRGEGNSRKKEVELSSPRTQGSAVGELLGQ